MSIRRIQKGFTAKAAALILAFLLLHGNLAIPVSGQEKRDLEGPFKWATGDFQAGKYYDARRSLELLLSYYEDGEDITSPKAKILKGKIHLLLGATYERLRSMEQARQQYRLAKELLSDPRIENVDLDSLTGYRSIFMQNRQTLDKRIIVRPKKERKKRRISPLLVIAGVAAIAAGAYFLLKKKDDGTVKEEQDFDTGVLGIQWVDIPEGEFLMGDNFNAGGSDELPVHAVHLSRYRISRFEVTFDQYDRFCELTDRTKPYDGGWGRGNRPVVTVTWGDANSFCNWLSEKTGKNIHLPTEAQWEKAARGTDQRRYPWGNHDPAPNLCNYDNLQGQTLRVGSFPDGVSPYGVYDMAGNAAEWCLDQYTSTFYSSSSYNNPSNLPPADYRGYIWRVYRGGGWENSIYWIRTTAREYGSHYQGAIFSSPNNTYSTNIGFRIVLED